MKATQNQDQDLSGPSLEWLMAHAQRVRGHFGGRAIITARIDGRSPIELHNVYGTAGGGVILVHASAHHGDTHGGGHPEEIETWVFPDRVVFEVRQAPEGTPCTGLGYLGISRTPKMIVPRTTKSPPKGHHRHF